MYIIGRAAKAKRKIRFNLLTTARIAGFAPGQLSGLLKPALAWAHLRLTPWSWGGRESIILRIPKHKASKEKRYVIPAQLVLTCSASEGRQLLSSPDY